MTPEDKTWTPNPHPLERRVPKEVREWCDGGGTIDVKAEGGDVWHDASPILSFIGPQVITDYRLK